MHPCELAHTLPLTRPKQGTWPDSPSRQGAWCYRANVNIGSQSSTFALPCADAHGVLTWGLRFPLTRVSPYICGGFCDGRVAHCLLGEGVLLTPPRWVCELGFT